MHTFLIILLAGAMFATVIMLAMGVFSLFRRDQDPRAKNRWMRLRVLFQALALFVFALLLLSQ